MVGSISHFPKPSRRVNGGARVGRIRARSTPSLTGLPAPAPTAATEEPRKRKVCTQVTPVGKWGAMQCVGNQPLVNQNENAGRKKRLNANKRKNRTGSQGKSRTGKKESGRTRTHRTRKARRARSRRTARTQSQGSRALLLSRRDPHPIRSQHPHCR